MMKRGVIYFVEERRRVSSPPFCQEKKSLLSGQTIVARDVGKGHGEEGEETKQVN